MCKTGGFDINTKSFQYHVIMQGHVSCHVDITEIEMHEMKSQCFVSRQSDFVRHLTNKARAEISSRYSTDTQTMYLF